MIAVIFEVEPREGHTGAYLSIAKKLSEDLMSMPGFVSVERFESLTTPGKLLSLSFWTDEDAIANWRQHPPHSKAQDTGRKVHFKDYRLRVAGVIRDYGLHDREQAPETKKE